MHGATSEQTMPSSPSVVARRHVLASSIQPSTSISGPGHGLPSERIGQLERTVHDVSKQLEELTISTRDGMSQLHHELALLQVKTHVGRAFSSATTTPDGPATAGSGAGPGATSHESSQSTIGFVSEALDPTPLAGFEAAGSDLRQNIEDLASVVGATERLLRAELAKQIEQLRSEIESERSKASQTAVELVNVTCTTAEIRQRLQDAEGKMQDQALELSTVKLSFAASVKDMQSAIRESEQRKCNGMSEEVAWSIEGLHMEFLQQLQEESIGSGRTDAAETQSQLDRVDAALRDLVAEHAARHGTLTVQVQQLQGSWLASQKHRGIESHELMELQGKFSLLADRVLVADRVLEAQRTQAQETNGATTEGLQEVGAKVADLQASLASVNNDVSKLAQDLVEMRTEHLTALAEVGGCVERYAQQAAQQGLAAPGAATENRFQELDSRIHAVQVATTEDLLGLTQNLALMRFNLGGITEVVAEAAAESIQRTQARLATEIDSKCDELAKFVGDQQEELRLKASSLMGNALAERVLQEREGPEPSGVSASATGSETRAHPDTLTAGSVFGADSKAVISMLVRCAGQVDALRRQVCDLQPRVLMLERDGSASDSKRPAQTALCKACRLAPAAPGTDLGRSRLAWAESHPVPESLPKRDKLGGAVASAQQPVPSESAAERKLCHASPGLRPLHQPSVAATRLRNLPSGPHSLSRTLSCLTLQGSCPSPPSSARSAILTQHSPRKAASEASPPGCLRAMWAPSTGQRFR